MRSAWADAAIASGEFPRVLVTITSPAITIRLASEPLDVEDGDTEALYRYEAGLLSDLDYTDEVDAFQLTGQTGMASVRLLVSAAGLDIGAEEEADLALMAASVEVALWWPGQTWQQRTPVMQAGRVSKLVTGRGDQPSEVWVDSRGPAAGASAVKADRDIGTDFPSLGFTLLDGKLWPIVVGVCKAVPAYKLGMLVSPGDLALGICGHRLADSVTLASLTVYQDGEEQTLSSPSLLYTADSTGDYTAIIGPDTGAAVDDFDMGTGAYTVDFTAGAVACARDRSRAATSAGDVLEWLMDRSGERIDWQAQAACTRQLSDMEIGVVRDTVTGELEVIRRRLVPVLPIIERRSAAGLYFQYVDPARADIAATLTFGQELIDRTGPPTYTDLDEVRNVFVVEYAWDGYTGAYAARVQIDGTNLDVCRYSAQLYGVQTADTIQCDVTWSERTATRIGILAAQRRALPRRRFGYLLHPSMYWLSAGDVVLLTDPEYGIAMRRAVVRQIHPLLRSPRVELEVLAITPAGRL